MEKSMATKNSQLKNKKAPEVGYEEALNEKSECVGSKIARRATMAGRLCYLVEFWDVLVGR